MAQLALDHLKHAITSTPVLSLLNFSKPFVLQTDALGYGIRALLLEDVHQIAFLAKSFVHNAKCIYIYIMKVYAITTAVKK